VADSDFAIVNSNDRHCYLRYPTGTDIRRGAFRVRHLASVQAFDEWDVLYRVDEVFNVIGAVRRSSGS